MKSVPQHILGHTAEGAALGFYYQTLYALLTLLEQTTDNAAIGVEQLDDIKLKADGNSLLYQLKHSILSTPPSISIKSKSFWSAVKVWVDIMPKISLSETTLHLVTVANIKNNDSLNTLTSFENERLELVKNMKNEARRIINKRTQAKKLGKKLPFADRFQGGEAFLELSDIEQLNLMRRVIIKNNAPNIAEIESHIASHYKLTTIPAVQRVAVAKRLVEWWDRQAIYALCGCREKTISHIELQYQFTNIVSDLEQEKLMPDFEIANPPEEYNPNGILYRQIELVKGRPSDHSKAIREEWRARKQRSKWLNNNPALASIIKDYDLILKERWSDLHSTAVEDCCGLSSEDKSRVGLEILRWTHEKASHEIRPISRDWVGDYYVRGSYQVLAIDREVGWHPDYISLLDKDDESSS